MFQSRRFWFSYRLRVVGDAAEDDAGVGEAIIIIVLVLLAEGLLIVILVRLVLSAAPCIESTS